MLKLPSGENKPLPFILTLVPPLILSLIDPEIFFKSLDVAGTYGGNTDDTLSLYIYIYLLVLLPIALFFFINLKKPRLFNDIPYHFLSSVAAFWNYSSCNVVVGPVFEISPVCETTNGGSRRKVHSLTRDRRRWMGNFLRTIGELWTSMNLEGYAATFKPFFLIIQQKC